MTPSDRLWTLLYGTWGPPRRASRMTGQSGQHRKYTDIAEYSFSRAQLADHLAGRSTYAATLGAAGTAWAGCKDYDSAGEAEILAALKQAAQRGITAAAFILLDPTGGHMGGHVWLFYDRPYPVADIRAQLRSLRRNGSGEDYPSGNPIRLPFGYHQVKQTRGTLVLQDGRRFRLDVPTELAAGLEAFFALPLNSKPEPAPADEAHSSSGAAWGDAYEPEEWNDLSDGGPLWRSPYIARAASTRPDLAKLLRDERVTLTRDNAPDDSDSAQVAALAFNLSSADIDRQQARAIADYLRPQLRPNKAIEHYRAHFDAEWERYKPAYYTGRKILILGPEDSEAPQALPAAEHTRPPKSRARKDRPQKVAGALGYLEWLRTQLDPQSGSVQLSQTRCAAALGCSVRTIKRYEKQLGAAIGRRVFARRQAGCLFILAPDVVTTSDADVVIGDAAMAQQHAPNAQPVAMEVEHPAAVSPPGPVAPALLDALVGDAFDVLAEAQVKTTFARVRKLVLADAGDQVIDLDQVKRFYAVELKRRQWARRDQRDVEKARRMGRQALARMARSLATQAAAVFHALRHGQTLPDVIAFEVNGKTYTTRKPAQLTARYGNLLRRRAGIYAAEEARRDALEAQRLGALGYTGAEQADMLAFLDDWRGRPPRDIGAAAEQAAIGARWANGDRGAGVLPLPAAALVDPSGIVGRLYQLRDQRQGASGHD